MPRVYEKDGTIVVGDSDVRVGPRGITSSLHCTADADMQDLGTPPGGDGRVALVVSVNNSGQEVGKQLVIDLTRNEWFR